VRILSSITSKLREEVESVLDKTFEVEELEKGLNTIYLLSSEDEKFILKVHTNPKNKAQWFRAEPEIYERISQELNIPSPNILYKDLSCESYQNMFYVMEAMEGENPEKIKKELSQENLEQILYWYGEILGKIHEISLSDGYGILGREDCGIVADSEQWNWCLEGAMSAWKSDAEDGWEEPPEIEYDEEKVKEILPDKPEPALVHSDNRLDNILIQGNQITAFLDWSHSWSAHRYYDLARAEYLLIDHDLSYKTPKSKQKLREKLFDGYRQNQEIREDWMKSDIRKTYRYANTLWLAAGFGNWGAKLSEKEREETREDILKRMDAEKPEFL